MPDVEFRGVDNLVYAEVLTDDNETGGGYTTGPVKMLSPVATISKEIESSSATHYYDNRPAIVIDATGADTITLTVQPLTLSILADITGQYIDTATGALGEGIPESKYFALGYRSKFTDGTYRYVWRYKGKFGVPSEESNTEDDGTDATNQELTYTGIATMHKFTKPDATQKGLVVDEREGKADISEFFDTVTTIDTLTTASGF